MSRRRVPIPKIRISGGHLPDPDQVGDLVPLLELVAQQIATHAKGVWMMVAQADGLRNTGPGSYVGGISAVGNVTIDVGGLSPDSDDPSMTISVEIENLCEHADIVEDGHGSYHLPSVINWNSVSGSIKRTTKGTPYLSIPMRHAAYATPDERREGGYTRDTVRRMMPPHIYEMALKLHRVRKLNVGPVTRLDDKRGASTFLTGRGPRFEARSLQASDPGRYQAAHVAADRYHWPRRNRRLDRSEVRPMIQLGGPGAPSGTEGFEERRSGRHVPGSGNNPGWGTSKYHGMFKTGGRRHTQYMTIRTLTPDSEGWHIPAQAGKGIARMVANGLQSDPELQRSIDQALEQWVNGLTGGA